MFCYMLGKRTVIVCGSGSVRQSRISAMIANIQSNNLIKTISTGGKRRERKKRVLDDTKQADHKNKGTSFLTATSLDNEGAQRMET